MRSQFRNGAPAATGKPPRSADGQRQQRESGHAHPSWHATSPSETRDARSATQAMLTTTAIAAVLIGSSATTASSVSASPRPAHPPHTTTRSSRPDRADWEKIKSAAWLRDLGARTTPHRPLQVARRLPRTQPTRDDPATRARPLPGRTDIPVRQPARPPGRPPQQELDAPPPVRRQRAIDPRMRPATSKPARPAGSRRTQTRDGSTEVARTGQRRDRPRTPSRAHHTTPVARRDLTSAAPSPGAV